jgi:hypothetical protein
MVTFCLPRLHSVMDISRNALYQKRERQYISTIFIAFFLVVAMMLHVMVHWRINPNLPVVVWYGTGTSCCKIGDKDMLTEHLKEKLGKFSCATKRLRSTL